MCHAAIAFDIDVKHDKRQWHGDQFKELERRHFGIAALDLWIKNGGWRYAIARHRAKQAHLRT